MTSFNELLMIAALWCGDGYAYNHGYVVGANIDKCRSEVLACRQNAFNIFSEKYFECVSKVRHP